MEINFTFGEAQFNRIFPFYILINPQLVIESNGQTLEKLFPGITGKSFDSSFTIKRPKVQTLNFESLQSLTNQLVVIECANDKHSILRGQMDYLPATNQLVFLGSPWFDSIEDVTNNKLSLHDFAFHDSMTDLLHVMKTQDNTNEDLRHLLQTVNRQKDELKNADKEIRDIALFPTQSPDPMIRINFAGDLLQNNPAAAQLDFIDFENTTYRNDDFFRLIAGRIDTSQSRWTLEANSGDNKYSFVCIPMKEESYINIYGRDISQQKKDQKELKRLSLIAQQTRNGVIITDAAGKIEWANNAFEKTTGYKLAEIQGKKPGSFLQGIDTNPDTVLYMREKMQNAEAFTCELYNYKKTGEGYWLRINGQPIFDTGGKVIQFFAIEEDITKEKEADSKLEEFDRRIRIAMQKIGDNVWEHDFATEETVFSQQEYNLLGYSSDEFSSEANLWFSCIHEDDKHLVIQNDLKYRSGQIDHHSVEYRMVHKNGTVKWVLDRGVVIEKTKGNKPLKLIGSHTDITRQKTIEKELEAVASRLTSLIENLYAGVLLENAGGTISLVNKKFCDMFGISAEPAQLIGADCSAAAQQSKLLFKNPDIFIQRIEKLLKQQTLVIGDRLEMHDGRYLERDFIPIWNEGRYDGHLWVYTDITGKINADKKLDEQRIFYEKILDNIPSDIAVFSDQHQYLYLNPKAISDKGLRKWIIGKKDEDYVKLRNKPASLMEGRRKLFNSVRESKELKSWEEELKQPDGSSKCILRNMYPVLNQQGEVDLVIGYGVDITNIKTIQQQVEQSEKRYRDVIDNSLALVTTHDMDGKFITVNPMVGKIYGYSDDEMVGHSLAEFVPERDKALFKTNYLDKIKEEKNFSGIFRVLHKNGSIIYTLFNNYLKEEPGKDPYVIGFAVDITDRIKAEKELKLAKKITEELADSKQNFLANMSHEIRTPMNAIMGMTSQLNKTSLDKDQLFFLDTIRSATDNLLIIINDILDLSKIEAGKLALENIGFEPKLIIERAMAVMIHKAEEKGLRFTNSVCDKQLSEVLIGDPYRLNQVFLNLISNAIKFTENGGVDISYTVLADNDKNQVIQARVTDTGIGMEETFAKKLFQKFKQEDESVTRRYGGTGLGMSICKELVELMGGRIYVESVKGKGTSVVFEILFEKGKEEDLPKKIIVKADGALLAGKKILLVDDNKMNRLVASAMLKSYGVEMIHAVDGMDAIEKIRATAFDLVFMDVQMPVLDGIEATKIIRQKISTQLPIIALTAFAIKGDNLKCIDAGMNDYLSKPFEESQLVNIASKWLGLEEIETAEKPTIHSAETPLFNLSKINELAQGDAAFIEEMKEVFIEQATLSIDQFNTAFKKGDTARIKAVAHRIKPSIDNMCIATLQNEIRDIEANAEDLHSNAKLESSLAFVEMVLREVIRQLK